MSRRNRSGSPRQQYDTLVKVSFNCWNEKTIVQWITRSTDAFCVSPQWGEGAQGWPGSCHISTCAPLWPRRRLQPVRPERIPAQGEGGRGHSFPGRTQASGRPQARDWAGVKACQLANPVPTRTSLMHMKSTARRVADCSSRKAMSLRGVCPSDWNLWRFDLNNQATVGTRGAENAGNYRSAL